MAGRVSSQLERYMYPASWKDFPVGEVHIPCQLEGLSSLGHPPADNRYPETISNFGWVWVPVLNQTGKESQHEGVVFDFAFFRIVQSTVTYQITVKKYHVTGSS
jgi:hypothetical protein